MKTSFSSNLSIQNSLRQAMEKAQKDLVAANLEVTTGLHADMGVALGSSTTHSLDLTRDLLRIESLQGANGLAKTRIDSSEGALKVMAEQVTTVNGLLTGLTNSDSTIDAVVTTMKQALNTFISSGNSSVAGEYLFAGTNSDVKPLTSYSEENSALKTAVDAELTYFMANQVPPVTSKTDLSASQMGVFLDDLEKKFNGTEMTTSPPQPADSDGKDFWKEFGSKASDSNMTTRITSSETIESSVNANDRGFRNFVFGAVVSIELLPGVSDAARAVVSERAQQAIGRASAGISSQRTQLGLSSERITKATDSLSAQKAIFENSISDLQSVDPYEAATRVNSLKSLLEAAYTLTARIQQLSLINYL
ncbi:flagellar hook-associated family protein [Rhizobium sp. 0TCS1.26]|uniref:flagellar hook-associated family protein n=1 Tax=Rhizobium sp. 0TCS1.26 TaxID=3142623 RepID=UPI003D2B7F6C